MERPVLSMRQVLLAAAGVAALGIASGQAFAAEPFLVGALNPVSGAGSPYGSGMQKAIAMAADEINADGGACGRQIQVVSEDTQTSPDAAVLAVKKLIDVNKVQVVMGTWSSGVTLAVMPITTAAGLPEMNTSGAPAISTEDKADLVWRFQATNGRFGQAFAKIAKERGFKRPATMAYNNASGLGNTEGFAKAWKEDGGKVVASVVYEPKQASYRSELQQILAANPDVVVMGSYLPDTTIILREWYQSGQNPDLKWIIPGWAANEKLVEALGPDVTQGVIAVDSISNENAPSYAHFAEAYKKATGQPAGSNVYAAMTYDMMVLWGLAMQADCSKLTPEAINGRIRGVDSASGDKVFTFAEGKKALEAGKAINYQGASSQLAFDQYGDVTPDFSLSVVEKGEIVRKSVVTIGK
ncbi:amino acid/amide ABC transporter substrate-binding protein, HAAT family [Tistlia consotensis]|uniref:Amino acid/amide ABC transporter substrate-binding protein, HAAT family n=1 Tax=Tistlia consotensis USBA 355 TaxID=560819 RepID=A0A1Y6C8F3_9PROT|nr:ABC transporter substrate-binding protein [Tistlia consotensis]SMF51469.1 amino acid/amide ABC transporter substrate-binding protein, HAAT family [Tistlia consotensis USBA 355]SNR84250.1 amino acid/amide ABC transporter substrate-binding protein, HAAT family [Tistlia consotensis]